MSNLLQTLEAICVSNGTSVAHWQSLSTGINSNQDQIEGFLNYLKGKLQEPNLERQLLLLDVIDYLVDQCTITFWTQISSKAFLSLLLSLLKSRNIPELQVKILYLIKKWAQKFEQYKDLLPNFREIYTGMINSGVVFPNEVDSTYQKYLGSAKSQPVPKQSKPNDYSEDFNQDQGQAQGGDDFGDSYVEGLMSSLSPELYEKKYAKLLSYLTNIVENLALANEIIDNSKVGSTVEDSLKDIADSLRNGNNRLIETISSDKLKDEKLMEMSLGIIEDINRTMNRYETLKLKKNPEPFLSTFTEKNIQKGISPKKKSNPQPKKPMPSIQHKPQEIDPNIRNVNDLFDIFSKSEPVNPPQVNLPNVNYPSFNQRSDMNQGQQHPMDLFDINPPQVNMPQKPKEKSQVDLLAEQLSMTYNNNKENPENLGYRMPNPGMNMPGQGMHNPMGVPNQGMGMPQPMPHPYNNSQMNPNMPIDNSMSLFPPQMPNSHIQFNPNPMSQPQLQPPSQPLYTNSGISSNQPGNPIYATNPNYSNINNMPNPNYMNPNPNEQNLSESERKKLNAIDSLF